MDHKDVLRRFIDDAEAGRLGRKRMQFTGTVATGLVGILIMLAIIVLAHDIWRVIIG